jgi:hypothetical protein
MNHFFYWHPTFGKGEKLLRQGLSPQTSTFSLGQPIMNLWFYLAIQHSQANIPQYDSKNIVEVMGDAPRQGAQRFHFLRLKELLFQLLAGGQVYCSP